RPSRRSRRMPGALISQRTRARSPTGPIPGSAAIVRRPNTPIERTRGRRVRAALVRLVWVALILLGTALPARADDFATLVSALAVDSFADKEQAVLTLGKLGGGRAVPVLTALKDGLLRKTAGGRVLISSGPKLSDPVTGAEVSDMAADQLDRIRVNN